ncbi:MAG TPA: DPP IV N-terminal domain-containing protein [Saprospiraceae bacterium]|nr:DPP IV N-terminal domain-containing protein [Saprospiraceae bacterium]
MKKFSLLFVLCLAFVWSAGAQNNSVTKADYRAANRFAPAQVRKMVHSTQVDPHWLKESNRFWYTYETNDGQSYYIVDPVRGSKELLFDNAKLAADLSLLTRDPFDAQHLPIKNMKFINNETALRFSIQSKYQEEAEDEDEERGETQEGDQEKEKKKKKPKMKPTVWWFEYDLNTQTLRLLEDYEEPEDRPSWASMAPDSSYVLFAKNHNIYWMDKENYLKALEDEKDSTIVENQWTEDGEEFFGYGANSTGRGETEVDRIKNKDDRKRVSVLWSPNSKRFAMIKSDYREVKELFVINSIADPRPTLEKYKYHMPGEKEAPQYELHVFDFEEKEQKIIDVDTFKDQTLSLLRKPRLKSDRDNDYNPPMWLADNNNEIYFTRQSRDQKRFDVCKANFASGAVTVLVEERQEPYVENYGGEDIRLVNGGEELIQWSERDGWAHFYLYDGEGKLKNQITSGPYHCEGVEQVDEANRVLYFWANGKEEGQDPYFYHLYRVNFDGSGLKRLTPGNYTHSPNMNDEATHFVSTFSRVNTAPQSVLMDNRGNKVMDLEATDLSKLMETGYQFPEPYTVKADDGITDLYGVMYRPFNFDSAKNYPVLVYVYPGPQTEAVNKAFSARMDRLDRMAQLGFVVLTVGNRGGHPARSRWYHSYGYGDLRDYGLADKKTAVEQMADRYDFIDIDRVGIHGHSGGGFMSTAAMLVYPDFFKVAVSSSGNHDNSIYNRWWSEKHHGVKEVTDDEGNISFKYDIEKNQDLAKNLKGKLLITTGDIDNNVHPGLTIRMANALIKANKRFDFFLFPGQRHGYGNMNEYFFWLRADYFVKHLMGDYESSSSTDIIEMNRDKAMRN